MKKLIALLMTLMVLPMSFAITIGDGITPDINTEDFPPLVWMCDHRIVMDDATEPGRVSDDGEELVERINNYAFEGEQIQWKVLVMDKNGIEKIEDVFATIGAVQGPGNDIEVDCNKIGPQLECCEGDYKEKQGDIPREVWKGPGCYEHRSGWRYLGQPECIPDSCNARILEEKLEEFDDQVMEFYECTLTVETPLSMYDEHWVTVEALDLDLLSGTMAENEYWFFNPIVALSIVGDLIFNDVRAGTDSYSETLLVGNEADPGSGVMLDMFISGTDFYDSESSGAMCPTTNQLSLSAFRYFATNGAYSTANDWAIGGRGPGAADNRAVDPEGYVNIGYGIGFNNPTPFYNGFEIIQQQPQGPYWVANVLAPGAEMALTFKLRLPEPCNGDFDTGAIYFWGEAI